MTLQNTIALITGASSGIGEATARALAAEGTSLILVARRGDRLRKLADELRVPCHIATLDVRDAAAMRHILETLPPAFAKIDILVNNAGLALGLATAEDAELADWEQMIDTNIKALVTLTRLVLPGMKQRGRGHVVNVSSVAGSYHYPAANVYGATKAFVTYFSLALRADLLGAPIRVTNIEPGMTETEFSQVRFHGDKARGAAVYQNIEPLTAENIAASIRFAVTQPAHVNINRIEIMPTMQAPSGLAVKRNA